MNIGCLHNLLPYVMYNFVFKKGLHPVYSVLRVAQQAGLFIGDLKWGECIDKCWGGLNMRKLQIYIKKQKRNSKKYTESGGGVVF